jgi:hypothetical protein
MWIKKLSTALGLDEGFQQDWGICNADPNRVAEFIQFCGLNDVDDPWEPEALAELIFESMNDALQNSTASPSLLEKFRTFVRSNANTFPQTLDYWSRLAGNEEFPVAKIILKETA